MTKVETRSQSHRPFWSTSATALGVALPFVILHRPALMYTLIAIGIVSGLLAVTRPAAIAHIRAVVFSKTAILIGCMFAAFFVSSALGNTPLNSLRKWVQLPLAAAGALALYIVLVEMPEKYRDMLLTSLTAATVFVTLVLLIDMAIDDPGLSYIITGNDRPASSRYRSWSSASAMLLPFIAAWLFTTRDFRGKWVPTAILAFCALCLIASGGRAGWVGALAAFFVWAAGIIRWYGIRPRLLHVVGLVVITMSGLGFYSLVFGAEFVKNRLVMNSGIGIMSGRLDVWRVAVEHLSDSPLFGIGLSGYRHLPDATYNHPHNWVLEMGLETGLIGFALYSAVLAWITFFYLKRSKHNIYALAGLASLTAFIVSGLANTSIFNMWWVTYFIVTTMLGLVLTLGRLEAWKSQVSS